MGEKSGVGVGKGVRAKPMVEPEGHMATIMDGTPGNGAVKGEAVGDNGVDEGAMGGRVAEVSRGVRAEPSLPGELLILVEFVDEVHEQRRVLPKEIPHPEASSLHRETNLVPSD